MGPGKYCVVGKFLVALLVVDECAWKCGNWRIFRANGDGHIHARSMTFSFVDFFGCRYGEAQAGLEVASCFQITRWLSGRLAGTFVG